MKECKVSTDIEKGLISKRLSAFIKGVAIILMLLHHLFAYPERYPESVNIISVFNNIKIEQIIGEFGKYCIPLFLFVSGYGFSLSTSSETPAKYYINKIVNFFISYWIVFFIFVPISYFYSQWDFVRLDSYNLLLNLFALSSSYNHEWWFILPYLLSMGLTPFFHKMKNNYVALLALSYILWGVSSIPSKAQSFLFWQPAYVLGFIFSNLKIREGFLKVAYNNYYKIFVFLSSLIILSVTFLNYGWDSMPFMVVFLILIILIVYGYLPNVFKLVIEEVGNKSLFIWLTHSFYCYHFAKDIVYYPRVSLFIFLELLIVSYLTSVVLIKVNKFISLNLRNRGFLK
jgi:hypothetical protein